MSSFFSTWTWGDWTSGAVMLGIAIGIGFVIRHYYLRWREEQETQAESERLFFEEAEREIRAIEPGAASGPKGMDMAQGAAAPAFAPAPAPAPPPQVNPLQAQAIPPLATAASPAPAGESSESDSLAVFINKLRKLGIFQEQEGALPLPPPSPPAAIWRMRSGGLALVLDRMESEVFLAHQAQRFRLILIRSANGKPLVVRRFEDFLTEEIEGPEAFERKK